MKTLIKSTLFILMLKVWIAGKTGVVIGNNSYVIPGDQNNNPALVSSLTVRMDTGKIKTFSAGQIEKSQWIEVTQ